MGLYRDDGLPGAVQCRADQVVHGRIDNGEVAMLGALQKLDPGQQYAGVGGNGAARLHDQFQLPITQPLGQRLDVIRWLRGLFLIVGHSQAAPHVQMADMMPWSARVSISTNTRSRASRNGETDVSWEPM